MWKCCWNSNFVAINIVFLKYSHACWFRTVLSCFCRTQQSWTVVKATVWLMKPKIFTVWSRTEKFDNPWLNIVGQNVNNECLISYFVGNKELIICWERMNIEFFQWCYPHMSQTAPLCFSAQATAGKTAWPRAWGTAVHWHDYRASSVQ